MIVLLHKPGGHELIADHSPLGISRGKQNVRHFCPASFVL